MGLVVAIAMFAAAWEIAPRVNAQQDSPRVRRRGAASLDAALNSPQQDKDKTITQLREGTVLSDQLGEFKITGDRISFQMADHDNSLQVLENLALERVWKVLKDTPSRQWNVSGTVTEYRNRNFLLIQRAVMRLRGSSREEMPE